ncbi:hypothetical protein CVAR292_01818 [Corynebacterium variabile]|uniref:Uncharacterized protein n=1 Tax=Corynebacterium variabile TaxID=1727 RepID=A0A0X2NLX6_9CORY|nr:hypothetical protein CVAR292_01818 [Corynebacterium variabile]
MNEVTGFGSAFIKGGRPIDTFEFRIEFQLEFIQAKTIYVFADSNVYPKHVTIMRHHLQREGAHSMVDLIEVNAYLGPSDSHRALDVIQVDTIDTIPRLSSKRNAIDAHIYISVEILAGNIRSYFFAFYVHTERCIWL